MLYNIHCVTLFQSGIIRSIYRASCSTGRDRGSEAIKIAELWNFCSTWLRSVNIATSRDIALVARGLLTMIDISGGWRATTLRYSKPTAILTRDIYFRDEEMGGFSRRVLLLSHRDAIYSKWQTVESPSPSSLLFARTCWAFAKRSQLQCARFSRVFREGKQARDPRILAPSV